jgi:hypothetical protein
MLMCSKLLQSYLHASANDKRKFATAASGIYCWHASDFRQLHVSLLLLLLLLVLLLLLKLPLSLTLQCFPHVQSMLQRFVPFRTTNHIRKVKHYQYTASKEEDGLHG